MRKSLLVFPAAVLAAFVYSLISVLWPCPELLSDSRWRAAEEAIAPYNQKDDMVIVHPAWEDGALRHFKKNFIILGKPNTRNYDIYPRIWVILTHGHGEPDYLDGFPRDFDLELEGMRILRYSRPDADQILYDFYPHIGDAKVYITRGRERKTCDKFKEMRWYCPVKEWNFFGQRSTKVRDILESCLWMHPLKGWVTRGDFHGVQLGRRIAGEYGLTNRAARLPGSVPVTFRVRIDNKVLGDFRTDRSVGWHTFDIDTRDKRGRRAMVSFEVEAPNDALRHFCFRAQVRDDDPGMPRSNEPPPPEPIVEKKKEKKKPKKSRPKKKKRKGRKK